MACIPAWMIATLAAAVGCATYANDASAQLLRDTPAPSPTPAARESLAIPKGAAQRSQLHIVGSSSMAVFIETISREFVAATGFAQPLVELAGGREGIRAFCTSTGIGFPDVVASSRRMVKAEYSACLENGMLDIIEVPIGYDGVIIATERGDPVFNITPRHMYLALAAEVPRDFVLTSNIHREALREAEALPGEDFIDNPFKRWIEIDARLPDVPISVYGPGPGSATRDFVNVALIEAGCRNFKAIRSIYTATDRFRQCISLRGAPYYVAVPEPFEAKVVDALIGGDVGTLGLVTFDLFDRYKERIVALPVLDQMPTYEALVEDTYPLRRTIFFYFKRAHMLDANGVGIVAGLRQYMDLLTQERIFGTDGLLDRIGLVPLPSAERVAARRDAGTLKRLSR
jgi:phosphate transport system substrate-binding protein